MSTEFYIGCDPEVFVSRKGKVISAYGLIPGTKKEPFKVPDGAIQVDGMALEINTEPVRLATYVADRSEREFAGKVRNVLQSLKENLPEDHAIRITPSHAFGEDYIAQQPEEAKELGCDPDFNAYTGEPNPAPDGGAAYRTAAGHIHLGWGADIPVDHPDHFEICRSIIKNMDLTAGFLSVLMDPDPVRRNLYGKAGAFRPKSYGVEYRTPSNVWIKNNDFRRRMYNAVQAAVYITKKNWLCGNFELREEDVQDIINQSDVEKVKVFAKRYRHTTDSFKAAFRGLDA